VAWTTVLGGGLGAFALLLVVVWVLVFWSLLRNFRLAPPRVRALSQGEQPRYLELVTERARGRFEELGFREAGYLATQPMMEVEPEIVQLVMRNDETRTVAYLHARHPFTEARPSTVILESFLPGGSVLGTSGRFSSSVGAPLANRSRSPADDDQGIYRDHLAALARAGGAAIELPATFEGLVALAVAYAAWIWRTRLEQGVVVADREGGFRFARWASLASIPRLVVEQLRGARAEARRQRLDRERGPAVDARAPEIRQFLDDRARRKKELSEAMTNRFKMSRARTATLWVALVIGFTITLRILHHAQR
jgi:hypothetical protein